MTKSEIIQSHLLGTVAVSENYCKTCRIVDRETNETVLKFSFRLMPKQEDITRTVSDVVDATDCIPNCLIPAIIRQVESTVVFKLTLID